MNRPALFVALLSLSVPNVAGAATAAFAGTVTVVEECPSNLRDCLTRFTVRIEYYDYCSRGSFGRASKVGEVITHQVRTLGSVGVIDGELTNARTMAAAFRPGTWGYFYEHTWHNLRTTPDFVWGELVRHDPATKRFVLRLHRTHKDHHLEANPPVEEELAYDDATSFRIEEQPAKADALADGCWVQVHEPRGQIVLVRTPGSAYDSSEQVPADEGKRGFANDLTRSAVLAGIESETPGGVLDVSARVSVLNNDGRAETLPCRKTSFVLDGKLAPVHIANRAGRRVVLCHYRSEKTPHKVFVESRDDAVRGTVERVAENGRSLVVRVTGADGETDDRTVLVDPAATIHVDGRPAKAANAFVPGHTVTVHPARGRTVVCFPPAE